MAVEKKYSGKTNCQSFALDAKTFAYSDDKYKITKSMKIFTM